MTAPNPESIRDLAAGYALGALTPEESRAFEAALEQSPELAREVAEYREVNALLALRPGSAPDPALKQRLLERVAGAKVVPLDAGRRRTHPLWIVGVAAAAIAAVSFGVDSRRLRGELSRTQDSLVTVEAKLDKRERTLDALLTAEFNLTVVQLTTSGTEAPGIQFFWNRRANVGVLHAFRLPPPPTGKVYQLWLIRGGTPLPSTTFISEADGHALVNAFQLPAGGGFEAAAVTLEPSGGSQQPTMPIVLAGSVSGS